MMLTFMRGSWLFVVLFLSVTRLLAADLRHVLGGWQIGGVTTIQSGTPINVTIGTDRANSGSPNQRPDLVGTQSANCGAGNLVNCIDATVYALPAQFTFGNAPRNHLRGPRSVITDLSLAKNFGLGGASQLQFRPEVFNVFNTVNFNNPGFDVWHGYFRADHLRAADAPDPGGGPADVLTL